MQVKHIHHGKKPSNTPSSELAFQLCAYHPPHIAISSRFSRHISLEQHTHVYILYHLMQPLHVPTNNHSISTVARAVEYMRRAISLASIANNVNILTAPSGQFYFNECRLCAEISPR